MHVHSNNPDQVLRYFLDRGQVFEVFIHNMRLQSEDRNEQLAKEQETVAVPVPVKPATPPKALGFVAVAAGSGAAEILYSLGVDAVVSGGQTMNPSTQDLFDAANSVNAESIIFLPNNSNIIMAARAAAELLEKPADVVPTKSVPQAFSAMFAVNFDASLEENVANMTEVLDDVKTGEVTVAVKASKDAHGNPIVAGDVIGIADGSIEAVTSSIDDAVMQLLEVMDAQSYDTLTILAGDEYSDDMLDTLVEKITEAYPDVDLDPQRGEQPLYPVIFSLE